MTPRSLYSSASFLTPCNCAFESGSQEAPNASTTTSPRRLSEVIVCPSIERSENSTGARFWARAREAPSIPNKNMANSDFRFVRSICSPCPYPGWGSALDEWFNLLVGYLASRVNLIQTWVSPPSVTQTASLRCRKSFVLQSVPGNLTRAVRAVARQKAPCAKRGNHPMCPCRAQYNSNQPERD